MGNNVSIVSVSPQQQYLDAVLADDLDQLRTLHADNTVMAKLSRNDLVNVFHIGCGGGVLRAAQLVREAHAITRAEALGDRLYALRVALDSGHSAVVEWLHTELQIRAEDVQPHIGLILSGIAACGGDPRPLQVAHERWEIFRRAEIGECRKMFVNACVLGWLAAAKYIDKVCMAERADAGVMWGINVGRVFAQVCATGGLEAARWFSDRFAVTRKEAAAHEGFALRYACEAGDQPMAQWLASHHGLGAAELRHSSHPGLVSARIQADTQWLAAFLDGNQSAGTPTDAARATAADSTARARLTVASSDADILGELSTRRKEADELARARATFVGRITARQHDHSCDPLCSDERVAEALLEMLRRRDS